MCRNLIYIFLTLRYWLSNNCINGGQSQVLAHFHGSKHCYHFKNYEIVRKEGEKY